MKGLPAKGFALVGCRVSIVGRACVGGLIIAFAGALTADADG
tara:strand:- start:744 stop:869 length:126 start_codon:yes stop_codon:yes gene_type:complete